MTSLPPIVVLKARRYRNVTHHHKPTQTFSLALVTCPSPTIATAALITDAGVCQRSLARTTARAIASHDQGASSPTSCISVTRHGFISFNILDSCFLPSTLQPESSVACVYFHFILHLIPLPLPSSTKERLTPASVIYKRLSTPASNHRQSSRNIQARTKTLHSTPNPFMH